MSISAKKRLQIRQQADFACEYCSVSEQDTGGELTIDHYQPLAAGGNDELTNLIYACHRCNLYKSDYWATTPTDPQIYNPRTDSSVKSFWTASNGEIYGLTSNAVFTVQRLRLNRPALVIYRQRRQAKENESNLLEQLKTAADLLIKINVQQRRLLEEQQKLLLEQRNLLKLLSELKTK